MKEVHAVFLICVIFYSVYFIIRQKKKSMGWKQYSGVGIFYLQASCFFCFWPYLLVSEKLKKKKWEQLR